LIRVNDNLKVEATKEEKPQLLLHIDYDFTRVNDQRGKEIPLQEYQWK
jgi:hypothetical protein